MNRNEIIKKLKEDPYYLEYVEHQDEELCLIAVQRNGFALQFVKKQTEKICLEAIKQTGSALKFVQNQTPQFCIDVLFKHPRSYRYVRIVPNSDFKITLQNLEKKIFVLNNI